MSILRLKRPIARVAFSMRPVRGPWGGSSPFVAQLSSYLTKRNYEVSFDLRKDVDVIVIIDPRDELQHKAFGMPEIRDCKAENHNVKVVHRINECDQRKGTDFMDRLLEKASEVVDHTIFISHWLKDYHAQKWFTSNKENSVIYNGADPVLFHPVGSTKYDGIQPFRIVTHHWSNNPLKGFDEYQRIDQAIAAGALQGVELWVIGRWPAGIKWATARLYPPAHGKKLASMLRSCHAYVTASRWEPCGMHHVEGAQCGLPLIYHQDGGGIVEAGERYGIGFGADDIVSAIESMRENYHTYRSRVLEQIPCGDRMVMEYTNVIQTLIARG